MNKKNDGKTFKSNIQVLNSTMHSETFKIGNRTITLETGRIAKQAHGSVLLTEGNTTLLSTVVYAPHDSRKMDFLPLTVDYREYHSAAGRIPGSFQRREGRSADAEIIASRLCDRSMRPLFPQGYRLETQVISTLLSYDPSSDGPVLGIIAAAAALHLSEIPWDGPLTALRVGRVDGVLTALPSPEELVSSDVDLVLSMTPDGVVMLEGGAKEVPDAQVIEAIDFAQEQGEIIFEAIEKLKKKAGVPKAAAPEVPAPPAYAEALADAARGDLITALAEKEKHARKGKIREAKAKAIEAIAAENPEEDVKAQGSAVLSELEGQLMRDQIVKEKTRVDGRAPDTIRPIACEVDWLPTPHGSALFTRGETQAIVTLTLGSEQDRMLLDNLKGVNFQKFMLHYNFPPYSVGEARPLRGPGRREVGHGALARRALEAVLPDEKSFPYTVRILSEITESNGSSSMATVCGGSLALMDGGVPIKAPVAGIAMGLIKEGDEIVVLSDILGDEDHLGDMDFKVAGTESGVTAIQMDNKIGSVPPEIMEKAFAQAREGRLHILGEMAKTLAETRPDVKPQTPIITTLTISPSRVRDLIGPGGKIIQHIQRETTSKVSVDDSGQVVIFAPNRAARDEAVEMVENAAGTLDEGAVYEGVVTGVKEFGAFVRVKGMEGLVHISEWANERIERMEDHTKEGDKVTVKVLTTNKAGKLSLSRKAVL